MRDYERFAREHERRMRRREIAGCVTTFVVVAVVILCGVLTMMSLYERGCRPYYFTKIWVCPR